MNKFEQVYSDDHQMSVAGEGEGTQVPYKGGTLPRDLPNDAFYVTPPPWTYRRLWKHNLPKISFEGGNNQCLQLLVRYILVIAADKQEKTRPEMAFGDTFYLQFLSHLIGWEACGLRPEMTLHW